MRSLHHRLSTAFERSARRASGGGGRGSPGHGATIAAIAGDGRPGQRLRAPGGLRLNGTGQGMGAIADLRDWRVA